MSGRAVVFAQEVPNVARHLSMPGSPRESGAISPVVVHGVRQGCILLSKDGGVEQGINIVLAEGVDQDVNRDTGQP